MPLILTLLTASIIYNIIQHFDNAELRKELNNIEELNEQKPIIESFNHDL
jgi:hypothetical protein